MDLLQALDLIKDPNYTTIEQSKHLIDLGLPKESADMYYKLQYKCSCGGWAYTGLDECPKEGTYYLDEPLLRHTNPSGTYTIENGERIDLSGVKDKLKKTDIPCWTVGQLIKIYLICNHYESDDNLIFMLTSGVEVPDLCHFIITHLEYIKPNFDKVNEII